MKALMVSLLVLTTMAPAAFAKTADELSSFELNQLRQAIRGFTPQGLTSQQIDGLLGTLNSGDQADRRLPTALYQTYRYQNQQEAS